MTWSHPHILSSLAPHIAHTEHLHRVAAARQWGNFMQLGKGSPLQVDAALQILCIEKNRGSSSGQAHPRSMCMVDVQHVG